MKLLSGSELVGFIKERQAKQVRALRQAHKLFPKLAIVQTSDSSVIDMYVRLKKSYGEDILIDVEQHKVDSAHLAEIIDTLNNDAAIHGIIVQLPLSDTSQTAEILSKVEPNKDVDGLGPNSPFDPATALAINWLSAGYGIDLVDKSILIIGQGKLVGAPLAKMWQNSGYNVSIADKQTKDLKSLALSSDVIVSGTGVPGLITSDMIAKNTVLIDAGTASDSGTIKGDLSPDLYDRNDLVLTPQKGGVGPLTVSALFDNVIRATQARIPKD